METDDLAGTNTLRLVFHDAVISLALALDATFGDLAAALDALPRASRRRPIAIDFTEAKPLHRTDDGPVSLHPGRRPMAARAQQQSNG